MLTAWISHNSLPTSFARQNGHSSAQTSLTSNIKTISNKKQKKKKTTARAQQESRRVLATTDVVKLVIIRQHYLRLLTQSKNDASSLILELVIIARLRVYGLEKTLRENEPSL